MTHSMIVRLTHFLYYDAETEKHASKLHYIPCHTEHYKHHQTNYSRCDDAMVLSCATSFQKCVCVCLWPRHEISLVPYIFTIFQQLVRRLQKFCCHLFICCECVLQCHEQQENRLRFFFSLCAGENGFEIPAKLFMTYVYFICFCVYRIRSRTSPLNLNNRKKYFEAHFFSWVVAELFVISNISFFFFHLLLLCARIEVCSWCVVYFVVCCLVSHPYFIRIRAVVPHTEHCCNKALPNTHYFICANRR